MEPKNFIVLEITGVDSRLCVTTQCGEVLAVGKFRDGGTDASAINIFVAYLSSKGASPKVELAWTLPGVPYSSSPTISVREGVWQVVVRKGLQTSTTSSFRLMPFRYQFQT